MHELSIALSLIDLASEEARRQGEGKVTALYLRLGPLSGVVEEALRFSFDLAAEGTVIAGARLEIEHVPIRAFCPSCQENVEVPSAYSLLCPRCEGPTAGIVSGKELELKALEIEDSESQEFDSAQPPR